MNTPIQIQVDLSDGEHLGVEASGERLLIAKIAGQYYATSDICSHGRVLLSKGKLRGRHIICPLHGARFDVTSGQCLAGPTQKPIASYKVTFESGAITILPPL